MCRIMEFVSSTELIPRFVVTKVVQIKQKREVYVVLTVPRSITRNVNMKVVLVWSSTAAFVSGKQKLVINLVVCFAICNINLYPPILDLLGMGLSSESARLRIVPTTQLKMEFVADVSSMYNMCGKFA